MAEPAILVRGSASSPPARVSCVRGDSAAATVSASTPPARIPSLDPSPTPMRPKQLSSTRQEKTRSLPMCSTPLSMPRERMLAVPWISSGEATVSVPSGQALGARQWPRGSSASRSHGGCGCGEHERFVASYLVRQRDDVQRGRPRRRGAGSASLQCGPEHPTRVGGDWLLSVRHSTSALGGSSTTA